MASAIVSVPVSPRPRRKTAKAAAETISKALDTTEEDEEIDSGEEEYTPKSSSAVPPSSPKSKRPSSNSNKRRSTSSCNSGKKCALSPETTEYLKSWMLSPDHIEHPYPTEEEKAQIMRHCGIEMKQLTNWFVNNRKRIWKPKIEELKKKCGEDGVVATMTTTTAVQVQVKVNERDVKRKKTEKTGVVLCPKIAKSHATVKEANKKRTKGSLVNNPLDGPSCSPSVDGDSDLSITEQMPPLPPVQASATVTPLVDPMIIDTFADDIIESAPMLPMASLGHPLEMIPHSCNLIDPLTNKMSRFAQPCALCSACRDWNAGNFCPWDLTGIIGDISDDTSATATELTEATMSGVKEEDRSGSIVSEVSEGVAASDNIITFTADDVEALSSEYGKDEPGISSFSSTASFPVPQEDRQDNLDVTDIEVAFD